MNVQQLKRLFGVIFFIFYRFKVATPLVLAQVRWALDLNHFLNYITLLSLIINSSFFEVLRKYDLQFEMQVQHVTKYTPWRHTEA